MYVPVATKRDQAKLLVIGASGIRTSAPYWLAYCEMQHEVSRE